MTDMADSTSAKAKGSQSRVLDAARVRKRYRAETRFRWYGLAAIGFACAFLVLLLGDILLKGLPAFEANTVALDVTLDAGKIDADAIAKSNPEIMKMMEEEEMEKGPEGPAPGDIPERTEPAGPLPMYEDAAMDSPITGPEAPAAAPDADMDPMSQITQAVAGKSPEEVQAWVTENADLAGSYLQEMAKIAQGVAGKAKRAAQ